jgi:pyridoxal phosphate enzyme (YggS family)
MIGPLQTRKAPEVVAGFSYFDAVDRVRAAEALQQRCEEQDRTLRVLIEVNVSGEASKHGFEPEDLLQALAEMRGFDRLHVDGLMTMAPFGAEEDFLRKCFRRLKQLADRHGLPELSMGMTDDFEIAIEEGATQVRIGRALFE